MDVYTFEHSVSFSVLMMAFAKSMGLSDKIICEVGIGGLLHDIGKTLTPDNILNKPGKLTDEEFVIMKEHVVHSRKILEKTKGLSKISMDIAAQHHEKFDGNGYPLGLKGDQISHYGQMSAIVDVYDALTADRCYHKGKEPSEVLKLLVKWSGAHFNSSLVRKFIQSVGIYPAGSLVMLSNNHLAKVIDINENMLKPIVEVFINAKTRSYIPRKLIDLSKLEKITILKVESYEKWNLM
jgi:putative nucleotidyltransferase with HDIG domain